MLMSGNAALGTSAQRILIIEDDTLISLSLKSQLEKLGHTVVGLAANSREAVDLFDREQPSLMLVDIRLDGDDGLELTRTLMQKRRVPVIIISAYSDQQLINRAGEAGAFGYLIKPAAVEALAAQIGVSVKRFEEQEQLIAERDRLSQTLETRRLVDRAKGILIKRLNLTEPEAHRRLQQESQRRRVSLNEVAKKVIESDELLGG